MQTYRCHKVVEAAKIMDVVDNGVALGGQLLLEGAPAVQDVSTEFLARHRPAAGGYFVRYADGNTSYSPAKAFEEGYTKTTVVTDAELAALAGEHILQFFSFTHLPAHLQEISRPFAEQAVRIMHEPRNPERTVALRKLLESKDATVRARIAGPMEKVAPQ